MPNQPSKWTIDAPKRPGGSGNARKKQVKPVPTPYLQSQILIFAGYYHGVLAHDFQVLCGANPPTITSAPAMIATVDRPRSLGYTVPQSYAPVTMDVQIRFDNWLWYDNPVNGDLEKDIAKLWWMAGRGHMGPGSSTQGNPPTVTINSVNASGGPSLLVPPQVDGMTWYITNLAWDTGPLRQTGPMLKARKLGYPAATRGRQDVTVTVQQVNDAPGLRTVRRKPAKGNFAVHSDSRYHNIKLLAAHYLGHSDQAAFKTVMNLPSNKHLKLRNAGQRLKDGTKVWLPNSLKAQ